MPPSPRSVRTIVRLLIMVNPPGIVFVGDDAGSGGGFSADRFTWAVLEIAVLRNGGQEFIREIDAEHQAPCT